MEQDRPRAHDQRVESELILFCERPQSNRQCGIQNFPCFALLIQRLLRGYRPLDHQGCGCKKPGQQFLPVRSCLGRTVLLQPVDMLPIGGWRFTGSYLALRQFSVRLEHLSQQHRIAAAIQQCVVKRPHESERCLTPLKEGEPQHRSAV